MAGGHQKKCSVASVARNAAADNGRPPGQVPRRAPERPRGWPRGRPRTPSRRLLRLTGPRCELVAAGASIRGRSSPEGLGFGDRLGRGAATKSPKWVFTFAA